MSYGNEEEGYEEGRQEEKAVTDAARLQASLLFCTKQGLRD